MFLLLGSLSPTWEAWPSHATGVRSVRRCSQSRGRRSGRRGYPAPAVSAAVPFGCEARELVLGLCCPHSAGQRDGQALRTQAMPGLCGLLPSTMGVCHGALTYIQCCLRIADSSHLALLSGPLPLCSCPIEVRPIQPPLKTLATHSASSQGCPLFPSR